jgi:hypothetical protein
MSYSVAANDFMAAGGDGLVEFALGTAIDDSGILLRDAVAAYLAKHSPISAATDNRVTIRTR